MTASVGGASGNEGADGDSPTVADALRHRVADGPPLDVSADLTVTVDGHECRVTGYTDLLVVEVPSLPTALGLLWRLRRRLPAVLSVLAATDLTVELRVGGASVARGGAGTSPGPLARLAGLGPARVRSGGLVRALLGVR